MSHTSTTLARAGARFLVDSFYRYTYKPPADWPLNGLTRNVPSLVSFIDRALLLGRGDPKFDAVIVIALHITGMLGQHYRDGVNAEDALSVYRIFIAACSIAIRIAPSSHLAQLRPDWAWCTAGFIEPDQIHVDAQLVRAFLNPNVRAAAENVEHFRSWLLRNFGDGSSFPYRNGHLDIPACVDVVSIRRSGLALAPLPQGRNGSRPEQVRLAVPPNGTNSATTLMDGRSATSAAPSVAPPMFTLSTHSELANWNGGKPAPRLPRA